MAFEEWKVRLHMMLEEATHQPEDFHEMQEEIREEIAGLKAQGLPVPEDLTALEKSLEERLNLPRK